MTKPYDRAYFDRWYRGPHAPKGEPELARDVALAVAATESVLARPIETVLDVGAGEGRWQPVLRAHRPDLRYIGIEPSDYAIERYGEARNLHRGSFGTLTEFPFEEPFDLVICADVLHYLSDTEVEQGLEVFADLVGGVALIEIYTGDDEANGDRADFHARSAAWYRQRLRAAGLLPLGLQLYVHEELAADLEDLDLAPGARDTNA
jgi:predicted TPR repeat methyltransferase